MEGFSQPIHLILIAIVALIVLGPAGLGDPGGVLSRSVREFKENVDVPDRASSTARRTTTASPIPEHQHPRDTSRQTNAMVV